MLDRPREHYSDQSEMPTEAIPWYGWEAEEPDHGWLLTYVDVLSVILAMVVILLGRMAMERLPPTLSDTALEARERIEAPLPETESAPPVPPKPTLTREVVTPEVVTPEVVTPEVVTPEVVTPEVVTPEVVTPEVVTAEVVAPEERFSALVVERFPGQVTAVRQEQGVSVSIADVILFESAEAELQASARPILTRLTKTLQEIGEADIAVEGHTDSRPLQGGPFRTNWDLAAARANAVTGFLLGQGLMPRRLRAVSYGDTRPIADNETSSGQAANRRVELRVEFVTD
jgi:chemotaxis protein MotB